MRVLSLVAALVLATVVFSGCVGDDEPSPSPSPTPTPSASTSGSSGPPTSSSTSAPPTGAPPPTDPSAPVIPPRVETYDGNLVFRLRPPTGPMVDAPTNTNFHFELPMDAGATGYIMELSWNPATPLTENMGLWFYKGSSDQANFDIQGTSPLRAAVGANETSGGNYVLDILAGSPAPGVTARVAVNQPFTLTLVIFDGTPYDPAWTPTP